jgi:uncharacterized protein YqkB
VSLCRFRAPLLEIGNYDIPAYLHRYSKAFLKRSLTAKIKDFNKLTCYQAKANIFF